MPFTDILAQDHILEHFRKTITANHLSHAYIFTGQDGVGKTLLAKEFSKAISCTENKDDSCNLCHNCIRIEKNNHPDIYWIDIEEKAKFIKIENIRNLQHSVRLSPVESDYKIFIIKEADRMNEEASNCLLKTLEEPSGDTILILVSDAPARLLPTIRSRCRQMAFPVPERSLALNWLQVMISDDTQAVACLDEMGGRPLAAKALFEQDGLALRRHCDEALTSWAAGQKTLSETSELLLERELEFLLDWLTQRFHSLFRSAMVGQEDQLTTPWRQWVTRPATRISLQLDAALEMRAQLQRGVALNKRLALETFLINWA